MLRYAMAAAALKAFSLNPLSKNLYRRIGNVVGQRNRIAVNDFDVRVARGDLLVELCRKHQAVKDGDRVLEIGTGWMHWYSLYLRLFYDLRLTTLDIWDNRQLQALQAAAEKLFEHFEKSRTDEKARENLRKVLDCKSFEELYATFGIDYVIEPDGLLTGFDDRRFDFITSFHVLEHVPAQHIDQLARDMYRTLTPGGYTIHQIGIDDHLTHYDDNASPKQYLEYSDRIWRTFFENEVQYVNRWQTSDWLKAFEAAGFELVDKISKGADISDLK
ncbi:MAG: class I SAM-dependent methyltransferase, partial [Gammaproteobacteria bacterium]|nr:class I SAM-dependent methyltransferase [Gammaproteobacteria bacterium]